MMKRCVIAVGGGGMKLENPALEKYLLAQTGKSKPKVCFIPTAGADSDAAILQFMTVYSVLGIAIALTAAGALLRSRREPSDSAAIVLVAAVVLTFGSGLADITYLDRSQLPTTLSHSLARTLVAIVLGGSVGVLVTAAKNLRRPALVTVPAAPPAPGAVRPAAPGDASL